MLKHSVGNIDEQHEAEFIRDSLISDAVNDTSIIIPASIVIYTPNDNGNKNSEFDGLIIHLFRKSGQIILFEAKNTSDKPNYAEKCLLQKFKKLSPEFTYDKNQIETIGHDARLTISLTNSKKINE